MNEFVRLMETVENPGTFSVSGTLSSVPPGLRVEGVGPIALPFLPQQAEALIAQSEQAPFGRGEETIVDTSVRNVWQISAENFAFTNPEWESALQESVAQIGKELGLYDAKITAEPYKLLIYGEGSFFTAHRDTEKIPNMFATLVVNLPSEHSGGELIVSHSGQSQCYSFAEGDQFHPSFVAFYADCYHEVKPITAGYRICLIYNLALAGRKQQPLLAHQLQTVEAVGDAIQAWAADNNNRILAYLLEHDYSEKHLSLANLKNGDYAKAAVLLQAAEAHDCRAYLCLVTYYQTSYGEVTYYDRYSYGEDLDEDDYEEYEVDSEEVYAHALTTADGTGVAITQIALDEEEIYAKTSLYEGPGYGFSISEATGNEGATKDLWYHRGGVILWPKAREFDLLPRMDIEYGIHILKQSLQTQPTPTGEVRQQLIQLADHIIKNQPAYSQESIVDQLMQLGEVALFKTYLQKQLHPYNSRGADAQEFVTIAERFGWNSFADEVHTYLHRQRDALHWLVSLLFVKEPLSDEGQAVMTSWVEEHWQPALETRLTTGKIVPLLCLVAVLRMQSLTAEILAYFATQPTRERKSNFLTDTYGPAVIRTLQELHGHDYDRTVMQQFVADVQQRLQAEFPNPPVAPTDWARPGQLACDCEFCTEVNAFLPDPQRSTISFYKTLKRNLTHVEEEIEKRGVDLAMEIRKTPPKFAGTCHKTQRSYDQQKELFDRAQSIVAELTELTT